MDKETMPKKRPSFRKPKGLQTYSSPEELFTKLPNRARSHGYLRAPQVDALREYEKLQGESDIAFELPTGTGKTMVGLLIAEWRRRQNGKKVAYLTLTNQLAKQVLNEAEKLGIDCADITGTKDTRSAGEVGRYKAARAVGITTYSNLFNVNPVIQASDVIVFDDAHGGEHFVTDMWSVRIRSNEHSIHYNEIITAIRPVLTDNQYSAITNASEYSTVELVNVHYDKTVLRNISDQLERISDPAIHFPWGLIKNNQDACLLFASSNEIIIRPLIPPTYAHDPFSATVQRIYMSATLGGEGDLLKSYGVTSIKPIRVQHAQWGKRYIFMPGLYVDESECSDIIIDTWNDMETRRALILAPSFNIAQRTFQDVSQKIDPKPTRLEAPDIEESLESFIRANDVILSLAGRYDGLDLPGEDCRLLIMAESPAALDALERNLREHWKLGPLLRRRERVRLIQGMGRCTRDATDYAVIILLGQSLIDSLTTPVVVQGLPAEIQRELQWGIEQSEVAQKDKKEISEMILGLLMDKGYRKEANESIEELETPEIILESKNYDKWGKMEVNYSKALWEGNYSKAYKIARGAADGTSAPELAGYRAFWFYLAAIAVCHQSDIDNEIDCLKRACSTGVNTGFLDKLLRKRRGEVPIEITPSKDEHQAEAMWDYLNELGWHGSKFTNNLKEIKDGLAALSNPTRYHIGLEGLGKCLGAEVIRPTKSGAPDVIWIFNDFCFTFEVKSDKDSDRSLSKKDIQQAKGHPDWIKDQRESVKQTPIYPIIISPTRTLDWAAKPHAKELFYISTDTIGEFENKVLAELSELRTRFAGKEFGAILGELKSSIRQAGCSCDAIKALLCKSNFST